MKYYKYIKSTDVRNSIKYMLQYVSKYIVKDLTWTQDIILNYFETYLKGEVKDKLT